MSVAEQAPRFAMLAGLSKDASSDDRRELLRKVTETLDGGRGDIADLDQMLAGVASEYSTQARAEIARLIAPGGVRFSHTATKFAFDDFEVAKQVLTHSTALSDAVLLDVVAQKSQSHLMAITARRQVSETLSHALVERGDDHVVRSLLLNKNASIGQHTFEAMTERAQTSTILQAPLVQRPGVPVELLNDLYANVEAKLRKEIVAKLDRVAPEELERAFRRSRNRVTVGHRAAAADFDASRRRVDEMQRGGKLVPAILIALIREGAPSRTAFKIAFATLADVEFSLVERMLESQDLDTMSLLCRGANFERALFVALALNLTQSEGALARATEFGALYESVPVQAAQRALRFWKARAAA